MVNKNIKIYILIDPRDKIVKYVGKTSQKLERRYSQHIYQWRRDKGRHNKLNSWIKCLYNLDLLPLIKEIDNCNYDDWKYYEISYISYFISLGINLKNETEGGDEAPKNCNSEEARRKRIETIKTSKLWKDKSKRHSRLMKRLYKEGKIKLGKSHLSEEEKLGINKNQSEKIREIHKNNPEIYKNLINSRKIKVCSLKEDKSIDLVFNSVTEAGKHYLIGSSNITRVCKGKAKSGKTHNIFFKYHSN